MSTPPGEFYTRERWQNWIDRIEDEEIDPDDEDSARLLLNLQDDTAIAIAKILSAYEEDELDDEAALSELVDIREIVLSEVDIADEETAILIDGVQTSLVCVFAAAEEYVARGPAEEASVDEYIRAAADAEAEEDFDSALGFCAQAGTRIIAGDEFNMGIVDELEYGLVAEWVNGLDSLEAAMSDPEVVEEED